MLKLSIVILFFVALVIPLISLIFIIDQRRSGLKMFILGVLTYIVAETCIKLPVLGLLGYAEPKSVMHMFVLSLFGALFVETVQYFVIKFNVKRSVFTIEKFAMYSTGFICAYAFIIWGIDSVGAAAVIFLDDFKLIETEEIWNEIIKIIAVVPIQLGIVLLCVNAIKYKNILYFFIAVLLRMLSDLDFVFYLCDTWKLGSGVGILYLAVICVIMITFMRKQILFWKGKEDESN